MNLRRHLARITLLFAGLCVGAESFGGLNAGEAPAPRRSRINLEEAKSHWAYAPVRSPEVPVVRAVRRVVEPIDAFLLRELEAVGLTFAPEADRATLIRRMSFDLTGLPPTVAEVEEFERDARPGAVERLADRLLASPRYGERWGRHWLDVARYADTKDAVLQFGKDRLRPFAYTYREYVIGAFNDDRPFDQFIREQIAADLLPGREDPGRLAALGFLTLGRLYDGNPHDQIDDQIDTVTRGLLGLTVACARCHDHKYDAIPIADYYSLYGVFANSEQPHDLPLIEDPLAVVGGEAFEKKRGEAHRLLDEHVDAEYAKQSKVARDRIGDYLARVATTPPDISETTTFFLSLTPDDLRPQIVTRWRRLVEQRAVSGDRVFGAWARLMAVDEAELGQRGRSLIEAAAAASSNPLVIAALVAAAPTNRAAVARAYGSAIRAVVDRFGLESHAAASPDERELLALAVGKESPGYFPRGQTYNYMSRPERDRYGGLVTELDKVASYATNAPPARAMVVRDSEEPVVPRVFLRGSPARPGPVVPKAFLQVLAGPARPEFPGTSGRLGLADAIASPNNPLTARVFVNRVWMHHFGEPLVSSPSDFGARADRPSHPELLDHLAAEFMRGGWSVKKLHRSIVRSAAYRQGPGPAGGAEGLARAVRMDPDNRLLWRFPRRRLDLESMRDTLLFVAGRLQESPGGRPVDVAADPANPRRTVYGLVDRQDLPGMYRAFDFACPDQSIERRSRTTVPQQALFVMNSGFVLLQARALAAEVGRASTATDPARVVEMYRRALGRNPRAGEVADAVGFLEEVRAAQAKEKVSEPGAGAATGQRRLTGLEQLAQVLLMSNELMFVE